MIGFWDIFNLENFFTILVIIVFIYSYLISDKRKSYRYQGLSKVNNLNYLKKTPAKTKRRFNKHEEECRRIFEKLFNKEFKSIRPQWLQNPVTGQNLEIDGFCPDITTPLGKGLGFEMQGQQHYKYTPFFHKNPTAFKYQIQKDKFKLGKCRDMGILVIEIPHYVNYNDLERYIRKKCMENNVL